MNNIFFHSILLFFLFFVFLILGQGMLWIDRFAGTAIHFLLFCCFCQIIQRATRIHIVVERTMYGVCTMYEMAGIQYYYTTIRRGWPIQLCTRVALLKLLKGIRLLEMVQIIFFHFSPEKMKVESINIKYYLITIRDTMLAILLENSQFWGVLLFGRGKSCKW